MTQEGATFNITDNSEVNLVTKAASNNEDGILKDKSISEQAKSDNALEKSIEKSDSILKNSAAFMEKI